MSHSRSSAIVGVEAGARTERAMAQGGGHPVLDDMGRRAPTVSCPVRGEPALAVPRRRSGGRGRDGWVAVGLVAMGFQLVVMVVVWRPFKHRGSKDRSDDLGGPGLTALLLRV